MNLYRSDGWHRRRFFRRVAIVGLSGGALTGLATVIYLREAWH